VRHRVLVTDADSRKALAVVRDLAGVAEVWTASDSRISVAGMSRHSHRHLTYRPDAGFGDWVVETAGRHRIDTIVCPEEDSIIRVDERRAALEADGIVLTFPPRDVLDLAFDKGRTLDIAAAAGVATPPTVVLSGPADVAAGAETIGFPLVVKPRHSYYWNGRSFSVNKGPSYARTMAELRSRLAELDPAQPPPLLQSFIPGRGVGVFVLLAKDGSLAASFAHRRIRDIRPAGGASVVRASETLDEALLERSLGLLRRMGMWGVAMVEYRVDAGTGEAVLMEVNARLWGSLQLAIDAGVGFPRLLVEVAHGATPRPAPYRVGVTSRWWLGDLLRTLRVMRGRPAGYPGEFPTRRQAIRDFVLGRPAGSRNEVFRFDDPLPALGELVWAARHVR
jgi:predicted ATP-grasp superfamily ATP-dependent carboligase